MSMYERHRIPGLNKMKALQENSKLVKQEKKEYNWRTDYDWTDPEDHPEDLNTFECSICKETSVGFGNNPQPVNDLKVSDRCCNDCNLSVVIPERFKVIEGGLDE